MSNCKQQIRNYTELACTQEYSGINALAFVDEAKAAVADADTAQWSTASFWTTETYGGDIVIHDEVSGGYTPADVTGPGRGNQAERLIGKTHSLTIQVDAVKDNYLYWDDLNVATNYRVAWVGNNYGLLFVSDVNVDISANMMQENSLTGLLHWEVVIKWASLKLPKNFNVPSGIFN